MRYTTAYYLVLLYVTVMLKPLIPIISDELSHSFSEAIHISTVHAKYGSHHLEKELAASANDNAGKNQSQMTPGEQVLVHIGSDELKYNFALKVSLQDYSLCKPFKLSTVFISKEGPPPKFS